MYLDREICILKIVIETRFILFPRYDYDPEQFAGNQLPILVVGTKTDLAHILREKVISRSSTIAEECGADEMNLVINYII